MPFQVHKCTLNEIIIIVSSFGINAFHVPMRIGVKRFLLIVTEIEILLQ